MSRRKSGGRSKYALMGVRRCFLVNEQNDEPG